ncbi:MAG: sensor histidine kinase [Candidatus Dormibacteria bacterium]
MRPPVRRHEVVLPLALAVVAPGALTALLVGINQGNIRNYVFVYLGIVAILGLATGLRDAIVAAACSFLLVDFFFVRPVHSFQFADSTDLVNLVVFFGTAGLVGTLGSRRRAALRRAESLARDLQQANIELARLAETERQVRILEETDRLRREFLANVSHELRTPLASILTGATTLLQGQSLPDGLRAEAASMARESRRLNRLVSDLLDMTRIEGGIVEIRPAEVDLTEAIGASIERLHRQVPDRPVEVEVPASTPEVTADWSRLGQVLDNLLENADHAAPQGSPIRVTAARSDEGEVVVRVMDGGPGVPASLRGRIFDRFVRGGETSPGRVAGMGLGLPIVRGLVEVQGGRVWLEDGEAMQGACFAFSLPAVTVAASLDTEL